MLMRPCDDPRLLASLRHNCAGPILTALEDPRFCNNGARVKNNALVEEIIIAWMQSHDWKDIKELLDKAGAPVSLVYTMEDIFEEIIGDIFDEDDDGLIKKILAAKSRRRPV